MKKALIIFIGLVLFGLSTYQVEFNSYLSGAEEVFYYTRENVASVDDAEVLRGQEFTRVVCKGEDAKTVFKSLRKVEGVSVKAKTRDEQKLLEKFGASYVSNSEIGEISITYGYNPRLPKHVLVDGKKVNVQIAISKEVVVGYPLILGSY